MIRLKLLLEDNDVDPKNKTINVLFIGDNENMRRAVGKEIKGGSLIFCSKKCLSHYINNVFLNLILGENNE